jgi:hypothetical protein
MTSPRDRIFPLRRSPWRLLRRRRLRKARAGQRDRREPPPGTVPGRYGDVAGGIWHPPIG